MDVLLKFTTLGVNSGPYNLTVDSGTITPTTATRSELLAGKVVSLSSDILVSVFITVTSTGSCTDTRTVEVIPLVVAKSGIFYNHYVADLNIAPSGWHVPTDDEFDTLATYAGGYPVAGGKLKEVGNSTWLYYAGHVGTDDYGFTAKATGYRGDTGVYQLSGNICGFWNTTGGYTISKTILHSGATMYNYYAYGPKNGFSIRLLKDDSTDPGTVTDIEGNVYNTVKIGTQVWMKENLRVKKYNDGSDIPYVESNAAWAALSTPAYCIPVY